MNSPTDSSQPTAPNEPSLPAFLADRDMPCPSCGRNLRGTTLPQCPGCGVAISVAALAASRSMKLPPAMVAVRVLSGIAFLIAGYLAFTGLTDHQPAGCEPGAGCSNVLSSQWASLWGVPVSVPGLFVYLGIFICTFHIGIGRTDQHRRDAWTVLLVLASFAGLAALWFIYLQLFRIKSVCPYCMADHTCGLIISALVLLTAPMTRGQMLPDGQRSPVMLGKARAGLLIGMAALIMGLFMLAQLAFPASTHVEIVTSGPGSNGHDGPGGAEPPINPKKDGAVPVATKDGTAVPPPPPKDSAKIILNGEEKIAKRVGSKPPQPLGEPVWLRLPKGPPPQGLVRFTRDALPVRGEVNAKGMLICMVDYTCPHCRAFHHLFPRAIARYGDELAFMVMPMPLNPDCNPNVDYREPRHAEACELARLSLAVWKTDPSKFDEFDDWLFEPEVARTGDEALVKARELVGKDRLKATFDTGWPHEQALKHVRIYDMAGLGRIPKVMYSNVRVEGTILEADFWKWIEGSSGPGLKPVK